MRPRAPQVVVGAVVMVGTALALAACESTPRVKPWRHAPDPAAEAAAAPRSPAITEAPSEADVHAARGHTLRIALPADPGRLTAIVGPSVWARRITLGTIFEPLIAYAPPDGTGPGHYAPRLAHSWRVMPGGMEIRIELVADATFHDGHPLTTSDVQFTLDAVRDPKRGIDHLRGLLDDVEAIELVTAKEIRLRLKRPSGWVLRALAEIPILPMHVYDGSLLGGGAVIGSGPWKLASNKGGVIHLARNDKYWGAAPAINDIEFVYQQDAAVALTAAKRGELDIVPQLIPAHWPEQASSPGVTSLFQPLQLAPPRLRYFAFNIVRDSPLADARVRHALALLVDRRAIAKRVFAGLARPAQWPIWPGGPVDSAEAAIPDFDPAGAAKLLEAAGWFDHDKDGIRDKDGAQLHLVLVTTEKPAARDLGGPVAKSERELWIDAARRTGVVIEQKQVTEPQLERRLADGSYDIAELSWGGMVDSDVSALVAGPQRPATPRVERALDALAAAWDPAERAKVAGELGAALADTWTIAGIVAEAPQGLVHRRIRGARAWDGWLDLTQLSFDAAVP